MGKKKNSTQKKNRSGVPLGRVSAAEKRRLPKPRPGYEQFVDSFAQLMSDFSTAIAPAGIDVEGMRACVRQYQELATPRANAAQHLAEIDDTRYVAWSTGYKEMLLIYGRARQAARVSPDIAAFIKPFDTFMKQGSRKKSAISPPTTP